MPLGRYAGGVVVKGVREQDPAFPCIGQVIVLIVPGGRHITMSDFHAT